MNYGYPNLHIIMFLKMWLVGTSVLNSKGETLFSNLMLSPDQKVLDLFSIVCFSAAFL